MIVFGSKYIRFKVKPTDTIDNVKTRLHHIEGINPDNVALQTSEHPQMVLEGNCTLSHYNIDNRSFTYLEIKHMPISDEMEIDQVEMGNGCIIKYHIFVVRGTGVTLTLEVKSSDTVHDLKCMIKKRSGIPKHQQKIFFA
nr:hypothetical protein [Tanacetum cinerariifolium]